MNFRVLALFVCISLPMMTVGCAKKFQIRSEPSDAAVLINGKNYGKTPVEIKYSELPSSTYLELNVQKENYGVFSMFLPGASSAQLSSELVVNLARHEESTVKINRHTSRLIQAQKLVTEKKLTEALQIVDSTIAENPKLIYGHLLKASILLLSDSFAESLKEWKTVIELDPSQSEAAKMIEFLRDKVPGGST